ncbi:cyclic lactone autoinducer peptide [Lachnospiraceae bacterium 38-14]
MVGKKKKNIVATILGKVAFNSANAVANSRCMYCLHQPKQPTGMKKLSR